MSTTAVEDCVPIGATTIFERYTQWCDVQGEKSRKTMAAFGIELARHLSTYPQVKKDQYGNDRKMHWFGIEFLDA